MAKCGITIARAADDPKTAALDNESVAAAQALATIADYESRWPLIMYLERDFEAGGGAFDPLTHERGLARLKVTHDDYQTALRYREQYRETLAALESDGVFFATPSATGAAPMGQGGTGSAVYQWASSLAGNPVVSLPFMETGGLPLGLQLQGFNGAEAKMMAAARWLDHAFRAGEI